MIFLKNFLSVLLLTAFIFLLPASSTASECNYTIGVFFWHDSSNDSKAFEGIKDGMETAGCQCDYIVYNAKDQEKKASESIRRLSELKPDLIYGMGTGATKRLMKVIHDIPIVFTAVTNPVQTGITPDWNSSGRNITGNSNWIPTETILSYFKDVVPSLKNLGVLYDPDNAVSSMEVTIAKTKIKELELQLIEKKVKTVNNLYSGTGDLRNIGVDAIWVPIDILVYKNLKKIRLVADPHKIPLLASSHRGIKDGAIFGAVVDYHTLGKLSVSHALKILRQNIHPKEIPITIIKSHRKIINLKAAQKIGYEIPLSVLAEADEIIR